MAFVEFFLVIILITSGGMLFCSGILFGKGDEVLPGTILSFFVFIPALYAYFKHFSPSPTYETIELATTKKEDPQKTTTGPMVLRPESEAENHGSVSAPDSGSIPDSNGQHPQGTSFEGVAGNPATVDSPSENEEEVILEPNTLFQKQFHLFLVGLVVVLSGGLLILNLILLFNHEDAITGNFSALLFFLLSLPLFKNLSEQFAAQIRPLPNTSGRPTKTQKRRGPAMASTPSKKVSSLEHSEHWPSVAGANYVIPVETPFIIFLIIVRGIFISLLLLKLATLIENTAFPFNWLIMDSWGVVLLSTSFLWGTQCHYTIHPKKREILYRYTTPFYREHRDIRFSEVAAVVLTGHLSGWPLMLSYYGMSFTTMLVFQDGRTLPVFPSVKSASDPGKTFKEQRVEAEKLAFLLDRPFLAGPGEEEIPLTEWRKKILPLIQKSKDPKVLETRLWDLAMGSISLAAESPEKIKIDLPTFAEKVILGLILFLTIVTTGYFLTSEWKFLAENPRTFYLLIADCTSIIATVFGLWRWIIDEYYILDTESRLVLFHSRFLFITQEQVVATFDSVKYIAVQVAGSEKQKEYRATMELSSGIEVVISDRNYSAYSILGWQKSPSPFFMKAGFFPLKSNVSASVAVKPCFLHVIK